MKVHHIGIVVNDIDRNIEIYLKLGYKKRTELVCDEIQNNKIIFLNDEAEQQVIELIAPINETSSVYNFGGGLHHICYEVDDKEKFFLDFKQMKIGKIFTRPIQAPAINNREIVFGMLKNGTLVEFLF